MKKISILLIGILLLTMSGCSKPKPQPPEYDFGTPESWVDTKVSVLDLGDGIMQDYPSDKMYDWGQTVLYDKEVGLYKMWWCRQSPHDTIWYAESSDLKIWKNPQKILYLSSPEDYTTWIKMHMGKPTVLKVEKTYYMYLEAPATLQGWTEFDNNVLLATSLDGITWNFHGGNDDPQPVIRMTDEQLAASMTSYQNGTGGFYGIGQPSALYKDGKFFVYYTYSMGKGDKMYMSTSTDGIHFNEGVQVFDRASCGVKYNALTQRFMMTYEYTTNGNSNIFYNESEDGIHFTYSSLFESGGNVNKLSGAYKMVRGYPDFIGDGHGVTHDYTLYVGFMEGQMADGTDWRTFSYTWDIHFAAVNLPLHANRTKVLPNGQINTVAAYELYTKRHTDYDYQSWYKINRATGTYSETSDQLWSNANIADISRVSYNHASVPLGTTAQAKLVYDENNLYILVEVADKTMREDDGFKLVLDLPNIHGETEQEFQEDCYSLAVSANGNYELLDYKGEALVLTGLKIGHKQTIQGYQIRICLPWLNSTYIVSEHDIGLDMFVVDNWNESIHSRIAWNDDQYRSNRIVNTMGDGTLMS